MCKLKMGRIGGIFHHVLDGEWLTGLVDDGIGIAGVEFLLGFLVLCEY